MQLCVGGGEGDWIIDLKSYEQNVCHLETKCLAIAGLLRQDNVGIIVMYITSHINNSISENDIQTVLILSN